MDCRQVDRCLEANLDGRLGGFERVALRQHLRGCRACRAKVEAMSSFAAVIERTLAAADGPDWERLTPPSLPRALREPAAEPFVAPPIVVRPPARRPLPWRSVAVAAISAVVLLASQMLWSAGSPPEPQPQVVVPIAPTTGTLLAEATRRAADRAVDYAAADWPAARAWLEARGLVGLPDVDAIPGLVVTGVFLDHVAGLRAAGVAFVYGSEGPFSLYLLPAVGSVPAFGWAESGGLIALAGAWDGWQAVVVGGSGDVFPAELSDRLRGIAVVR